MTINLIGINNLSDSNPSQLIEDGLISFFDYGLLSIGNFINVEDETLKLDYDPNYSNGQVWRFRNKNLVWESGVNALVGDDVAYPGVSGIYVDGTYYSRSTTGNYAYDLDHINGRVVFDSAISTTSSITASYSHKYIDVIPVKDLPHLQEIFDDRTGFSISNSGEYRNDPRATSDLPFIGVELVDRRSFRPYQLGGGQYMSNDVLFHCVSSSKEEVNKLKDIVSMQNDRVIRLLDNDKIYNSGVYPVNYNGVPVSGAMQYPDLVTYYPHTKTLRLFNTSLDSTSNIDSQVIIKTVRTSTEMVLNIT